MGETCECCGRTFDISQVVRAHGDEQLCCDCSGEDSNFQAQTVQLSAHDMGLRNMALQRRIAALEEALREAREDVYEVRMSEADLAERYKEYPRRAERHQRAVARQDALLGTIDALLDAPGAREGG